MSSRAGRDRRNGATAGLILIAIGVWFLADRYDLVGVDFWLIVPAAMILAGIVNLFNPESRGGSFPLLGAGIYLIVAELRLFGLGYGEAWPIFLITAGIGMLVSSLLPTNGRHHDVS